ncbi:MAG TPA: PHP domain-containing protein [Cellulomonas sp.]
MRPDLALLLRGDHHVHSTFSDDARSTLEQNATAAAARGLTTVRAVEHVRGGTTWLPDFVAAAAAHEPLAGLTVRTGVETKVLDTRGTLDLPPGDLGVDAVLVADHQVPGPDGPWTPEQTRARVADGMSHRAVLDQLVDGLLAAVGRAATRAPEVQLAHCFSVLPKIGMAEADLTGEQVDRWAAGLAHHRVLVEVNEKWACPGPRLLGAALSHGARLVAATDSHTAEDVGRYVRVPAILEQVDR